MILYCEIVSDILSKNAWIYFSKPKFNFKLILGLREFWKFIIFKRNPDFLEFTSLDFFIIFFVFLIRYFLEVFFFTFVFFIFLFFKFLKTFLIFRLFLVLEFFFLNFFLFFSFKKIYIYQLFIDKYSLL